MLSILSNVGYRRVISVAMVCAAMQIFAAYGQDTVDSAGERVAVTSAPETTPGEILQFSFDRTPWRDVIEWLAESADLALHIEELPTGSFTYSDPNSFTSQEAIDRINLFLLPRGFTLVQSGKLLSVINLSDPRGQQQLDTLARLITLDQLEEANDHTVVKCIFPLADLDAEDAVEELSVLNLMTTPAVFARTNQLMITDTAGKLKNVKQILDAFEPHELDNGTVVKSFTLENVDAEDILIVARPHLGLATGEMIGIDVSLSADTKGKNDLRYGDRRQGGTNRKAHRDYRPAEDKHLIRRCRTSDSCGNGRQCRHCLRCPADSVI